MFLSVIEFCRDDGAAAAPMNKSAVFLVDEEENDCEAWMALGYMPVVSWPRVSQP
jgi:hypothetical protein